MAGEQCPEFERQESDDRIVMSAAELAIVFSRIDDRWMHQVETGVCGRYEVARSVENPGDGESPGRITSPVYQEIHRHDRTGQQGLCSLLTGLVFQHHLSAVVTLTADAAAPGSLLLEFDVADRCRAVVETLAATYLVGLGSSELAEADPQRIVWTGGKLGQSRLEFVAAPPTSVALAEAGRQATLVQAVAHIDRAVFTHRLCYSWRWVSASGLSR